MEKVVAAVQKGDRVMSFGLYLIGVSIFGFAFLGGLYAVFDMLELFVPMWRNRQREREEIRQLQHQARVQQMRQELEAQRLRDQVLSGLDLTEEQVQRISKVKLTQFTDKLRREVNP